MIPAQRQERDLRVLVLAPYGRDGQLTCEVLGSAGIGSMRCEDLGQLCDQLNQGAGAIVLAAEALRGADAAVLTDALREQPAWSDIPLVLATASGQTRAVRDWMLRALEPTSHVTLLERPIRVQTLVSVVRSALSTRRRQYEMRELIEELRLSVQRLDAEHAFREHFVNLLAHDLRGPLGVSKMTAQMMARQGTSADIQTQAGRIEKSVDRADAMVRNLLDAHRLRAGHPLPVKPQACDLMEIARDVSEDLGTGDRARLTLLGPARLEGHWDPDLLRRALWNLVTNAIKYGAPDTPIEVSAGRAENVAWIRVHNSGPSIPAEEQRHLYEAFVRTRGTDLGAQRGWGLGLTLVLGVAAAHGGVMEVSSAPEAGTAFTLRIPINAGPQQP